MTAGVTQLGYLGFEVGNLAAWEKFATEVLGLTVARRFDGGIALRNDSYAQRFILTQGPADDVSVIGFEVADEAALTEMTARLRAAGVTVDAGSEAEAAARMVRRLVKYQDPAGIPCELYFGAARAETPFASTVTRSGFIADEAGLGHAVISARTQAESQAFYTGLLGFRLSDHIKCDLYGYHVDIAFLHANKRHHSIAFGDKQRKRIHHFMLEVRSMDDVGLAYDRALKAGVKIAQTLGRHPNDRMFSFYAKTPSGFQFELGWGGREIDDATWTPTTYDHISEWGHHAPQILVPLLEAAPRGTPPADAGGRQGKR